jgi:DNA invertase Pin-like site-specific DNA recombinase
MAKQQTWKCSGRVVGLTRASTNKQDLSPEVQREALEKWCLAHNKTLVAVFEEKNVSGDTRLSEREKLQEALRMLKCGDVLLVAVWDRLARGIEETFAIKYQVRALGAKLMSCDGVGDQEHEDDNPMLNDIKNFMFSFGAELEKRRIKERTSATLRLKASRGEVTGRLPYGYQASKDEETKVMVERADEQQMIQVIRTARAQGMKQRAIVDMLAEQGYKTRKGTALILTQLQRIMKRHGIS